MKKIFFTFILFFGLVSSFSFVFAQEQERAEIIPCATQANPRQCDYNDVIALVDNLIDFFVLYLVFPLCVIACIWSGYLFLTAGDSAGKRTQALSVFWHIVIGLAIVFGAWILVNTILVAFGLQEGYSLLR